MNLDNSKKTFFELSKPLEINPKDKHIEQIFDLKVKKLMEQFIFVKIEYDKIHRNTAIKEVRKLFGKDRQTMLKKSKFSYLYFSLIVQYDIRCLR